MHPEQLLWTLALDEPIRLITQDVVKPAPTPSPAWLILALVAVAALLAIATWMLTERRARIERNASEYAFRALARHLHMGPWRSRLIRRLALAHGNASPVALLLSDHALLTAADRFAQAGAGLRDRERVAALLRTSGAIANGPNT